MLLNMSIAIINITFQFLNIVIYIDQSVKIENTNEYVKNSKLLSVNIRKLRLKEF